MSWFCNTETAREHKKNCKKNSWECGKCIWIDESSNAMSEHGKEIVEEEIQHPLYDMIISTFNGSEIN